MSRQWPLEVWTLDFRAANAALRERHAVGPNAIRERLSTLKAEGVREAMVLSTCNRVVWVSSDASIGPGPTGAGEILRGEAAIRHLCRVASGLESLVLGEPQILGQMRDAWTAARDAGTSGPELEYLMPRLIGLAKQVRRRSGLGTGAISVAHVGVEVALRTCSSADPRVLMIGAGKMAAIAVRQLRARGVRTIHVANRTYENAAALGGCPVPHEEIYRMVANSADIVICCAAAPHPILDRRHVTAGRSVVLVDLGMPRNVDPSVREVAGVTLVDVDGLASEIESGHEERRECARKAEEVLERLFARLMEKLRARPSHAGLASAQRRWEAMRRAELDRVRPALGSISRREWEAVEELAWRLTRKLTHDTVFSRHG